MEKTVEVTEREKQIIECANEKNVLINADALKLLKERDDFERIIGELAGELAEKQEFVIDAEKVGNKLLKSKIEVAENGAPKVTIKKTGFRADAKDMESRIRIIKEWDVTGQSCSDGTVKDFLNLFRNRFEFLRGELRKRHSLNPREIKRLRTLPNKHAVDMVGIVSKKWVTKNGNTAVLIEDLESECIVIVSKNDTLLMKTAEHIVLDDVIGIKGVKISEELIGAREILWPDIPNKQVKLLEKDVSVVGLTDLHIGSKLFLEKSLNKFVSWIRCETGSEKEREKVGKVKYLVISGDNVDGIGIYPDQYSELNIRDINKQYDVFCEYILQIPEYIEIIISPGNHDAVRRADPQPALPKQLVEELYSLKNVHLVGSPSWAEIEGLKTLVYHGASIHDLCSSVSLFRMDKPEKCFVEMLRKRSLMPTYGLKQPYVPEKKDFMLIREAPDLFFTGDVHHNGYDTYRGATVINSGTFQARTGFQVKLGHVPTPGIVPLINLKTREIEEHSFYEKIRA